MTSRSKTTLFLSIAFSVGTCPNVFAQPVNTGSTPQSVAPADFNNDGRIDLAIAHVFDDRVQVLTQESDGSFTSGPSFLAGTEVHPLNFPRTIISRDINSDSWQDLIVLTSGNRLFNTRAEVNVYLSDLGTGFHPYSTTVVPGTETTDLFPVYMTEGQFSGDCQPDLAVAERRGNSVRLLYANIDGGYDSGPSLDTSSLSSAGPEFLQSIDLNSDGLEDLLVLTEKDLILFEQLSPGSFSSGTTFPLSVTNPTFRSISISSLRKDSPLSFYIADATGRIIQLESPAIDGTFDSLSIIEDASFDSPIDLQVLYWENDFQQDIAVADFAQNQATLLNDDGSVETLATGDEPRRIESVYINNDSQIDLLTINQGDREGNTSNPDINIFLNPNVEAKSAGNTLGEVSLGNGLGVRLSSVRGASGAQGLAVWYLENDYQNLQEINPSSAVNSNLSSKERRSFTFSSLVGGVAFRNTNRGYALAKDGQNLIDFNIVSSSETNISTNLPAAIPGYHGLAYDQSSDTLYTSDPSAKTIYLIGTNGQLKGQWATGSPIWDLTIDTSNEIIYGSNPQSNHVHSWELDGTERPDLQIDLSSLGDYFCSAYISSVSFNAPQASLYLSTTTGLFLEVDTNGEVKDLSPIAPATEYLGYTFNPDTNEYIFLSPDLHLSFVDADTLQSGKVVSLYDALMIDSTFRPVDITWDSQLEELLLLDSSGDRYARFLTDGTFIAFETINVGMTVLTGINFDRATESLYFRSDSRLYSGTESWWIPSVSNHRSLNIHAGNVLLSDPRGRSLIYFNLSSSEDFFRLELPSGVNALETVFEEDGNLAAPVDQQASGVASIEFDPPVLNAVSDWSLF